MNKSFIKVLYEFFKDVIKFDYKNGLLYKWGWFK
jgi:hypothetical protein